MPGEGKMRESWVPIEHVAEHKNRRSLVYELARFIGSPFNYDVAGLENVQTTGPALFIANHLGALGPIEIMLSMPFRLYPWISAEMNDFSRAPQYLYDDFVHPALHLSGKFGMVFSTLLTKITVRLLKSIDTISIERFEGLSTDGFRQSLKFLREGRNLLIFPEDNFLPPDPQTQMSPFMPGFVVLCSLFQQETSSLLPVYPLAVHAQAELVTIGSPEFFTPRGRHRDGIDEFCQLLEQRVAGIYLEMQKKTDDILDG
jgi:1-acyl-sn-glycerol-3-phosphate acyltransferase